MKRLNLFLSNFTSGYTVCYYQCCWLLFFFYLTNRCICRCGSLCPVTTSCGGADGDGDGGGGDGGRGDGGDGDGW